MDRIRFGAEGCKNFQVLWETGDRLFCRAWHIDVDGNWNRVLAVLPASEHPAPSCAGRLAHEHALKDELDSAWAVRPLQLVREHDRTVLVCEDTGGELLEHQLDAFMELGNLLRIAISITAAVGKVHERGLVHKDIKPANILVNRASGEVRLMGFGIASRLPRERQAPEPPEVISGTLAYMAPEQTGRMNRSVDARSDLYALGVTLYEMLTGSLPFTASDPMEWVHCHIARKPVPPAERVKTIPSAVSAIVMKLLAKPAEERYQTAAGLESDLKRCLAEWEANGRIADFQLGEHDTRHRLVIPEKLYGREREIETLLAAFDRVVTTGTPELVLVSGYSGIGKSSVVNELHKVLVPPRGLFASGKFDQYKRDIPYATLAQAFQSLIRMLLYKSEAELAGWRDALVVALGLNGQLMVDLVPELKHIIGDQPPVPELPPQDAQRRFQLVFRRFIGVFAKAEHPLALFLDDLQWLDAATLNLLDGLVTCEDVQHLLVIGAYRDNEVDATHPLMRKLEAIRQAGAVVREISLAPLTREDVAQLIMDALHCEPEHATPLARLVYGKTAGNPFFAIQFISALAEEELLSFDHGHRRWRWDLGSIQAKGYTENVVDLMVGKLHRLPGKTQKALQQLACLGNVAEIGTLALAHGTSAGEIQADLWEAAVQELIARLDNTYKFVHDRIQEAAYSLIPEERRAEAHLRIGRFLAAYTPAEKREEAVFEIVNQLNRGATLITAQEEREQFAELNLIAGKRAKAATAYAAALNYLASGAALLADDRWERHHQLAFALELNLGECEFLSGELTRAEERLAALSIRAADIAERAAVTCLRVDLYTTLDQSDRAVAICLEYLRHLGIEWSAHPTAKEAREEYERIWSRLGSRAIDGLIDLPLMDDPASLATLDVLIKVSPAALFTDANLHSLVICRAVNLSIEHGNCGGSSFAYMRFGTIAGPHFGNYRAGFQFGQLGYELAEKRGVQGFQARTYLDFGGLITPWTKHLRAGRDLLRRAFESANRNRDLTYAAYSCNITITHMLAAGDPLVEVQRQAEHCLAFAQKARFGGVVDIIASQLGLIRTLRCLTPNFGSLNDGIVDELRLERNFSNNPALAIVECWYWIRKLQARFFSGDYASALESSLKAQRLLWTSPSFFEVAEYHFYSALALAASFASAPAGVQRQRLEALAAHHGQLEAWAENCPENFENRAALVGAEIARIEGREFDAMRLYEQAIRSARANGFVHNEALANELAARFCAAHGFEQIADMYLRNARYGYLRWGAEGKVQQLDHLYPQLREHEPAAGPTTTIGTPVAQLDLATILKVSQAVSGEIVLENLIDVLMRAALAHAGAERGLLIVPQGGGLRIAAEATIRNSTPAVRLHQACLDATALPESIVSYVHRTQESVILDDASTQNPFAVDPYLRAAHARSVLCLPLVKQGSLIAVLYLENNLAPRVFTPARIAVLKVLASEAATSLENSRLYSELRERDAKIRRLVDANIIGVLMTDQRCQIVEANDAFLDMVGYSRDDLAAGRLNWREMTPPEWHAANERVVAQVKATGKSDVIEKEYFRKDGSRMPVLLGVAAVGGTRGEAVAFVLDLTKRKRAEGLLAGEKRILEMVARGDSLNQILDSLCRLAEEQAPDVFASILLREGNRLRRGGGPSLPKTYTDRVKEVVIGPSAGSCGTAAYRAEKVIVSDIATDPLWSKNRDVALAHSLRACWSTPIFCPKGNVIATFALYYREPRSPNLRDQAIVEQLSNLAGVAIQHKLGEEKLREAQMELARANRVATMGQLTASIAHEVAQPLTGTVTNAQAALRWLSRQPPDLEEVRQALSRIVENGYRAGDVLCRIRDLVKKAPPRKRGLDVNEAILEIIAMTRAEMHKNFVAVQTQLAEDLPLIQGDKVQLQQVILNLIINAMEAMSGTSAGSRELVISTSTTSDGVLVAVRDTGPGLSPESVSRIFEPFFTTKPEGMGMGLSICRSIIEAHGGRLWVTANAPRGAIFQFTVPDQADSAERQRPRGGMGRAQRHSLFRAAESQHERRR